MNNSKFTLPIPGPIPPGESGRFFKDQLYPEYGAYYHICPRSSWGFFGRKNKIYLDERTKSRVAAEKRAKKRLRPVEEQKKIDFNNEFLKKSYTQGTKTVSLFTSSWMGFDKFAPATIFKNIFGKEIRFYKDYGFYLDPETQGMRIFKKTHDYEQYDNFDGDMRNLPAELKKFK